VADHFEETIGLRVTALEAEAQSVKEHFVELKEFITFSLTTQLGRLRTELKQDISGLDQRLGGLERRFGGLDQRIGGLEQRFGGLDQRLGGLEQRFGGLEQRFDRLERKMDANHEATRLILADILDRLPPRDGWTAT
jgi:chaperonin cofactor prefoldin